MENTRGGITESRRAHVIVVGGQVEGDSAWGSASVVGDALLAAQSVPSIAAPSGKVELASTRRDVEDADLSTSDGNLGHKLAVHNPAQSGGVPADIEVRAEGTICVSNANEGYYGDKRRYCYLAHPTGTEYKGQ